MSVCTAKRLLKRLVVFGIAFSSLANAEVTAPPPPNNSTAPGILAACYDTTNGNLRLVARPSGAEPNFCTAGTASSGFTCNPNVTNLSDPCYCVGGGPRFCRAHEAYIEFND